MFHTYDLGASLYKTWSDEQRRDEIERLVQGFRNGLPLGILCSMSEAIAGSREKAREQLITLMPLGERQEALARETESIRLFAAELLLEKA